MRKVLLLQLILLFVCITTFAQWNPAGADITVPIDRKGHIRIGDSRYYYANRMIASAATTGSEKKYLLLHKAYDGTLLADHFVMGRITGYRGGTAAWNRKWTVEINTASAYNTNRGSIVSYNEPSRIVLLTYAGERYVAAEIATFASMGKFSFTGYALNESLLIINASDTNISNVSVFAGEEPVTTSYTQILMDGVGSKSNGYGPAKGFVVSSFDGGTVLNLGVDEDLSEYSWIQSRTKLASDMMDLMLNPWGGSVAIGTTKTNGYKLAVDGVIGTREVNVNVDVWADYVFLPGYKLRSLDEIEDHINQYGHLPEVPSEKEVLQDGVNLGEMNALLLKKIEELTLYLIEQNKKIEALQIELQKLESDD